MSIQKCEDCGLATWQEDKTLKCLKCGAKPLCEECKASHDDEGGC